MRTRVALPASAAITNGSRRAGMTLPELMISMAILGIMVTGFISIHLYGLRLNQLVEVKLGSSDEARHALAQLIHEVRSAGAIQVGHGTATAFTEIPTGQLQLGNAL